MQEHGTTNERRALQEEEEEEVCEKANRISSTVQVASDKENGSSGHKSSACWQQWCPLYRDRQLYNGVQYLQLCMLQYIDESFQAADIPYYVCGGTLLGAIRHDGFIPHDDDVDIECFADDLERIKNEIPTNPPFYTGFVEKSGTWEGEPVAKLQFFNGQFHVDVFPRSRDLVASHCKFPNQAEVFPLQRYQFCNIEVWGPGGNAGAYLDRCYGENWRDTVSVWNHDFNWYHGASFDAQKVVLSLVEYNAIIEDAGVTPPNAESSAEASFETFCNQYGDVFLEAYRKYRFERVWRRNRAEAEWRERQESADNDTKDSGN